MKILFFSFSIFLLISCAGKRVTEKELEFYSTKGIYIENKTGKPYTGTVYMNYNNSNILLYEFYCKNGYTDGYITYYYRDGTINRRTFYVMGEASDTQYFNPDGDEITQKEYFNKGYGLLLSQ